jgi:hypothetical protein
MSINWANFESIRDHPFLTVMTIKPMIPEFVNIPGHDQMALLNGKCRLFTIEMVDFGASLQS